MLSIARGGPRILFLKGDRNTLANFLAARFQVSMHTLQSALDCAGEGQTIIALQGRETGGERLFRVIPNPADEVLAALVNEQSCRLQSVRLLPRILFFRIFGEKNRVLEQIEKDFENGCIRGATVRRARLRSVLGNSRRSGIAVCFTYSPLNGPIAVSDVLDDVLHVENVFYDELYGFLRSRALWYFSEGLENRQWNEMEIRIYDSWGFFMEHYERLRIVLGALDAGMILGEGWGKDFAHILMSVQIYRLRLFTFLSKQNIKQMLIGLEYAKDGTRLADFDLYSGRDKVSWGVVKGKRKDREEAGATFRAQLLSLLSMSDQERLLDTERRLLLMRRESARG